MCHYGRVIEVQCLRCRTTSKVDDPGAKSWDCSCGRRYVLRHCAGCGNVSQVGSLQGDGRPWECNACHAMNLGRPGITHEPPDTAPVLMVTTNQVPGYRIIMLHGDVFGVTVRARSVFGDFPAGFQSTFGGEITQYTELLTASRNQARERLWAAARRRGANAVVAMRFNCSEVGGAMSEIAAYGTAVTVEPDQALSD
jgi:uncharacterized protein YbjQ (UPF0145 family)